ncbi:MAG TPA: DUF952 domain-containing protein, partial [Blastocatellia bacterium]|nr:DUF952 domain-containing protein [Blastocatellia bacterium]
RAVDKAVNREHFRAISSPCAEMFPVDGFVHCSTPDQVVRVADIRFRGQQGLVLLCIDTDRVTAEIRYENLEGGRELFPHIDGEINTDAVVQVAEFEPGAEGYFTLPAMLAIQENKHR